MGRPRKDHVDGDAEDARADLSLIDAVAEGDIRATLVALRTRLARTIQDPQTPPRDLAALTRRLMEITREIEGIDAADAEDDLAIAIATPDAPLSFDDP